MNYITFLKYFLINMNFLKVYKFFQIPQRWYSNKHQNNTRKNGPNNLYSSSMNNPFWNWISS